MAKKSRKAKSVNKFLMLIGAALAVVAVVMIFLPQVTDGNTTYNGWEIAFGGKEVGDIFKYTINFSFLNLLAYLLVIIGLAIIVLRFFGITKSKLALLVAAIALIAGGILSFFAPQFSTATLSVGNGSFGISSTTSLADLDYKLAYGAITGGVTAILAGLAALGNFAMSK